MQRPFCFLRALDKTRESEIVSPSSDFSETTPANEIVPCVNPKSVTQKTFSRPKLYIAYIYITLYISTHTLFIIQVWDLIMSVSCMHACNILTCGLQGFMITETTWVEISLSRGWKWRGEMIFSRISTLLSPRIFSYQYYYRNSAVNVPPTLHLS